MTEQANTVDDLREAVINAARIVAKSVPAPHPGYAYSSPSYQLRLRVEELDAAERPDPWQLISEFRALIVPQYASPQFRELADRLDAALAWHDQQQKEEA